jgi:hypothetical protein
MFRSHSTEKTVLNGARGACGWFFWTVLAQNFTFEATVLCQVSGFELFVEDGSHQDKGG